jgi:hypothetical protein
VPITSLLNTLFLTGLSYANSILLFDGSSLSNLHGQYRVSFPSPSMPLFDPNLALRHRNSSYPALATSVTAFPVSRHPVTSQQSRHTLQPASRSSVSVLACRPFSPAPRKPQMSLVSVSFPQSSSASALALPAAGRRAFRVLDGTPLQQFTILPMMTQKRVSMA